MKRNSKQPDFAYHLSRFFTIYLPAQRNLSSNTIKSYRDAFRLLLLFCANKKSIKAHNISLNLLTREFIEEFINWLHTERNCSEKTCNLRIGAIHSFFEYLQYEQPDYALQCQQILSIRTKKVAEPAINYLTIDGIKAILAQPDTTTKSGRRDLAILSVMYDTGARVSEIADLKYSDVRFISPATIRLTGKGRKSRIVPLLSHTADILSVYTRDYNFMEKGSDLPLFINKDGQPLTRFGISYILAKYADKAREQHPDLIPAKLSPHCIRHSKAMHLLQANVNLIYIRDLLGHNDVKTTEIYARADNTLKREALEKANPIKDKLQMPQWNDDADLMDWLRNL